MTKKEQAQQETREILEEPTITGLDPAFKFYLGGVEAIDNTTCINCGQKAKRGQTLDWFNGENKTFWWHFNLDERYSADCINKKNETSVY